MTLRAECKKSAPPKNDPPEKVLTEKTGQNSKILKERSEKTGQSDRPQVCGKEELTIQSHDSSVAAIALNRTRDDGEGIFDDTGEGFFSQACEMFNWDDFLYSLLFGLLPSTLDVVTDFRFALLLDQSEDSMIAAGLAYAIIILPGIDFAFFFLFQKVWDNLGDSLKIKIPVLFIYVVIIGLLLGGLLLSIIHMPTSLYYPALVIGVSLLGIKLLALVVHTPGVKKLSVMASSSEGNFESAYQLLLILLTWLTGGGRHLLPMATSLLVISKTRAERHLTFQPDVQMHEKTFEEKVVAVASHLPIFGLAAVFRIGSLALIFGCLPPVPDSANSLILFQVVFLSSPGTCLSLPCLIIELSFQIAFFAFGSLMSLLLLIASRWYPPLSHLTALQACQGVIGEFLETRS